MMRCFTGRVGRSARRMETLRESEEWYRAFFEKNIDAVLIGSPDGSVHAANEAARRMFGMTEEELIQAGRSGVTDPSDPRLQNGVETRGRTGAFKGELNLIRKDGTVFPGEISTGNFTDKNGLTKTTIIIRDITERRKAEEDLKKTEEALRRSEQDLRQLVEYLPVAMAVYSASDGKVAFVNRKFTEVFGYTLDDVPEPRNFWALGFPDEKYRAEIKTEWKRRKAERITKSLYETVPLEAKVTCKDGSARYVEASLTSLGDRDLVSFIDLTERKRVEAERNKMRNLESIGVLAGGLAHDFNNLLTAVAGNIAVAMMDLSPNDEAYKVLAEAERSSLAGRELTERLITFSKGGSPMKAIITLNKLIEEGSAKVCADSCIRCEYNLSEDLFPVIADDTQIREVMHNIVTNAKEAMPLGGTIRIETSNIHVGPQDLLPLPPGDHVRISVEDSGTGIEEEDLPRVFDPYFTTKKMGSTKGIGLGLALVHSIVKKHQGYVNVESVVNKGTTVRVYLPAYGLEREAAGKRHEVYGRPGGKILFMDDDESVRNMGVKLIARLGYEPVIAVDGGEAVKLYKEALSSGEVFDAVILDLTVRSGMGGKETFVELRSLDPHVRAVISSGYIDDPIMSNYIEYGFKDAIAKPYESGRMKEVLQKIIGGNSPS